MPRAPALPLPPASLSDPDTPRRPGRPPRLDREATQVDLDRETKEVLVRRAAQRGATLGAVIAEAVRVMLEWERRAA